MDKGKKAIELMDTLEIVTTSKFQAPIEFWCECVINDWRKFKEKEAHKTRVLERLRNIYENFMAH